MARRVVRWTVASVIVLVVLVLVVPWSPLNCRYEDVDITTGRLRLSRYLLFCKVSERIEDSPLTLVLPQDVVKEARPEWRRVNTFSPGVDHSPHHAFHGAIHQVRTLSQMWEMPELYSLPADMRQATALHVLALWQHSDNDSLAGDYMGVLYDLMDTRKRQQILEALPTLRMPLVETNDSQVTRTVFFPNGQLMDRIHGYVDSSGAFVRHGVWECWHSNGARSLYGHFENGRLDGRRFEWDRDGRLISIAAYNRDELSEYQFENLDAHPDYDAARRLLTGDAPEYPRSGQGSTWSL